MTSKKLPIIGGKELIKVLCGMGYYVRSRKGSHVTLKHPDRKTLTVPYHNELKKKLLLSIIKDAGLSREEFLRMME